MTSFLSSMFIGLMLVIYFAWKYLLRFSLMQMKSQIEVKHVMCEIIRSVQKTERRKSAKKFKRKRIVKQKNEANGEEGDDERKAYSRCSITFLFQVLQRIRSCEQYVKLVKWMGFEEVLQLDDCSIPRCFVKWIADNVSTEEEEIRIGSKSIKLSPQSVTETFGTPEGHLSIDCDEIVGKAEFLELFGLSDVPSIKFFGKKILAKEILPDAVFCRCFMAVSLGTLFCPNSSTKISTKYMGSLVVVDLIKDRNWSKFIHEWTMIYIKKYLKESTKGNQLTLTLGGCIYHLDVRCLDFIDFGPIHMPTTLPRIRVWKGKLIKVFSDMYMDTNGKYGAYPVKDFSETCYCLSIANLNKAEATDDANLKQAIERAIGDVVGLKIKDNIASCYANVMKDEETRICLKVKDLVVQVVEAFLTKQNTSEDTLKLSSSRDTSYKTAFNSGSTVKLHEEEEDECDNDALIQRKRRRTEEKCSSQNSVESAIGQRIPENNDVGLMQSAVGQDNKGIHDSLSQGIQSASLNHMVPTNVFSQKAKEIVHICSEVQVLVENKDQTKEVTDTLMDLNIKCIEEDNVNFRGFHSAVVNEMITIPNKVETKEICCLDEQLMNQDKNQPKIVLDQALPNKDAATTETKIVEIVQMKRSEHLQLARSKYFFKDEGTPSFRLMDCVDDNDKTIEEPEFYRPLEMDDFSYNEKCELAISMCKELEIDCRSKEHSKLNSSPNRYKNNNFSNDIFNTIKETNNNEYETTIQCDQREPSHTGLTFSQPRAITHTKDFVDLVSPEVTIQTQSHTKFKKSSSSDQAKSSYGKALIVGRRLFEGSSEDYSQSNSKNKSPIRELLNNFVDVSSPDVQVLGEKSFRYNSNNMNEETDHLYNTSLSLGSSNTSNGKENLLPQRIPQRSRYLSSPFDVNPSVNLSVQPIEQKIWEAVTTLCDDPEHKTDWAVCIDNVRVTMEQLGSSMKINGKVEAWLMNAFCRKLFRDNHPRFTQKHFFFNTISDYFLEKWKNEDAKAFMKKRAIESLCGANKARQLHLSDGLYFPSVFDDHWFIFLVDMKYRNFIFLDSWYGKDSSYHKKIACLMIKNFRNTWNDAGLKKVLFENFGTAYPNVPKQNPGNDCGIYCMKYMELYIPRNPAQCAFSYIDIPTFRIRYAHDILLSDHNDKYEARLLATEFKH